MALKFSSYWAVILLWLSVSFAGLMPGAPLVISATAAASPPRATSSALTQATAPSGGEVVTTAIQADQSIQEPSPPPSTEKQKNDLLKANFEKMKHDAGELVDLAKALQQELEKSNQNILSLDVVEKADKIEKLAKRIKGAARGF